MIISGKRWAEAFYATLINMIAHGRKPPYTGTPKRKRTGYREPRAGRLLKRFR